MAPSARQEFLGKRNTSTPRHARGHLFPHAELPGTTLSWHRLAILRNVSRLANIGPKPIGPRTGGATVSCTGRFLGHTREPMRWGTAASAGETVESNGCVASKGGADYTTFTRVPDDLKYNRGNCG